MKVENHDELENRLRFEFPNEQLGAAPSGNLLLCCNPLSTMQPISWKAADSALFYFKSPNAPPLSVVYDGTTALRETIEIFQRASLIIAPHGAGACH